MRTRQPGLPVTKRDGVQTIPAMILAHYLGIVSRGAVSLLVAPSLCALPFTPVPPWSSEFGLGSERCQRLSLAHLIWPARQPHLTRPNWPDARHVDSPTMPSGRLVLDTGVDGLWSSRSRCHSDARDRTLGMALDRSCQLAERGEAIRNREAFSSLIEQLHHC